MSLHDNSPQLTSSRNVERWRTRAESRAFAVARARARQRLAARMTAAWRQQAPPIARAALGDRMIGLFVPFLLTGIAAVEILLGRPIAVWFAWEFLGEPGWVPLLVWLLPGAIFFLDIWIALLLDQDARRAASGGPRNWAVVALAVVVLAVLPALGIANQLAILPSIAPEHLAMFWLRTAALVGISLVVHAAVVLSGGFIRGSAEYYAYLGRLTWFTFTEAWTRRTRVRNDDQLRRDIGMYLRLQREHKISWPDDTFVPLPPGIVDLAMEANGRDTAATTEAAGQWAHRIGEAPGGVQV